MTAHHPDHLPPDLIATFVGFREWRTRWLGGVGSTLVELAPPVDSTKQSRVELRPVGDGEPVWDGAREVRARCSTGHPAPHHHHHCGFNAWDSMWRPVGEGVFAPRFQPRAGYVVGAIAGWGTQELHQDGARFEYARPVLIGVPEGPSVAPEAQHARAVATALGLPTATWAGLEDAITEYGEPLPAELRPDPERARADRDALTKSLAAWTRSVR